MSVSAPEHRSQSSTLRSNVLPFADRHLLSALAIAIACGPLAAHGGQYRGPSSVAPPVNTTTSTAGNTGAGGNTAGSGGAANPGTTGGNRGGSAPAASPGGAAPTTATPSVPLGMPVGEDLGRWEFWWEFGKDPYLRLRDSVFGRRARRADDPLMAHHGARGARLPRRPDANELGAVAEALHQALVTATDRDIASACIVALAKLGRDGAGWSLHTTLQPFLAGGDQELRETAALALGIAGQPTPETVQLLCELVADGPAARKASGDKPVNERTRAFAAFALGLILQRTPPVALAHAITTTLLVPLSRPAEHTRDLKVAAIEALGLLPADWSGAAADALRAGIVRRLTQYYERDLGPGEQLLQAHVPMAIANLLPNGHAAATAWKQRCLGELGASLATTGNAPPGHKTNLHVFQSLTLALGQLAAPWDQAGVGDAAAGELLLRVFHDSKDEQTRSFALLAIAHQGGSQAKAALLRELQKAGRALELPWCAMALGVLEARRRLHQAANGPSPEADPEIRSALVAMFGEARNPSARAALAIALGLAGDPLGAEPLRHALPEHRMQDELAGYLALSLGMLGDQLALGEIRTLFQSSTQRPFLRMQSVRALGLLGDHERVDALCAQLTGGSHSLMHLAATATALGQIGDRRAIGPLSQMLADTKLVPLARAFAAVALGVIADKDPLPWNAAYATQVNYRASTATLTDGQSGILDIL